MDDTAVSVANRDDPIPVLRIPSPDDEHVTASDTELDRSRKAKLKEQAKTVKDAYGPATASMKQSIQDRFFENLIAKIVPLEGDQQYAADHPYTTPSSDAKPTKGKDYRSAKYLDRPNFSLGVMNANFRRFNARIGIVFVLQNRAIHLLTWRQPTATLSFLAIYTLLALNPHLLPLIPFLVLLFAIMTPSFLVRHPFPANDSRIEPAPSGPALAPASRVKPAPELSKDFFRNMRDLQNCMEDFSRVHDGLNEWVTPWTNFSDERVSSAVFGLMFLVLVLGWGAGKGVPWRLLVLVAGWMGIGVCHPQAQTLMEESRSVEQLLRSLAHAQRHFRSWAERDILLDSAPQRRQVEVFELQKYHPSSSEWESWLFSPTPYDPLSPSRIAGARAKGTQFFEDVLPPAGWMWRDKKWSLDLGSREWVEQRMITGVEIETEGGRWVYDLPASTLERL